MIKLLSESNMLITKISSGLGNQLFQYATAKALALRNNLKLKLDISYYNDFSDRDLKLGCYNIIDPIATYNEINYLKGRYNSNPFFKLKRHLSSKGIEYYNATHIKERPFSSFEKDILNLKGYKYIEGYWQNEKYFADYKNLILSIFTLPDFTDSYYKNVFNLIQNNNSISVHVRYGDYKYNSFFITLSFDYYDSAIKVMNERVRNATFFVFSDDTLWARTILPKSSKIVFIEHPKKSKPEIELYLMSQCAHNIIANSSFSWWGAWLNKNNCKIVICPRKWLKDAHLNKRKTSQNFTFDWIKL